METRIPNDKAKHETGPIRQKHRMAMGETVDGQSNPYGTDSAPKAVKVANGAGKNY